MQLQLAPECPAHSDDQICTVNGFTVRSEDNGHDNVSYCTYADLIYQSMSRSVYGIQLQLLGKYACCTNK